MIDDSLVLEEVLDLIIEKVTKHQANQTIISMITDENEALEHEILNIMIRIPIKAVDIMGVRCIIKSLKGGQKLYVKELP